MRLLGYLNTFLVLAIGLSLGTIFFFPTKSVDVSKAYPSPVKELPKNPFSLSEEAYIEIGEGPFSLKWISPQISLPDLRKELIFYGKNGRPDAGKNCFLLSLRGSSELFYARPGEKVHLIYQGNFARKQREVYQPKPTNQERLVGASDIYEKQNKASYSFCPKGQKSSLWFELKSTVEEAIEVTVSMLDENEDRVLSPKEHRTFSLHAQEFPKSQTIGWELGKYRVDTTLLVRQKARWIGQDLFLKMHGGEEFAHTSGKERIEFFDGAAPYACFISESDFLVWKNDKWHVAAKDEQTLGLPILTVRKIEDKILSFELWDPEGKGKILLSLIRTKDHTGFPSVTHDFKFVGAKTWAQFIVECGNNRMTLKPHDWLVLTQEGWKKLDSPEAIDDYVEGRLSGPLFVLDKFSKQNGHQALVGHLFNLSRTEVEPVELIAASTSSLANFCRTIPKLPPIQPETKGAEE